MIVQRLLCRPGARALVWAAVACGGLSGPARACDTCACRRNGEPCAPHGETVGAQPTIVSLASSKSTTGDPANAEMSSFKFAVVGDTQGLQYLQKLTTDMNAHNPAAVIYPGDLVNTGSVAAWNQWKSLSQHFVGGPTMRLPVPGNHDLPVGGDVQWQQTFDWLPDSPTIGGAKGIDQMDYYVDYQNTRFISVTTDSQVQGVGGPPAALPWLTNLLNDPSTQAKDHVFVYSHHPITFNNYDGTGGTAGAWWQSMAQSGVVDAVFVGHWHHYGPSQPDPYHPEMWEAISGTGNAGFDGHAWQNRIGYTLVEVDGPRVTSKFYGDGDGDGSYDDVLDQYVISDTAPPARGVVAYYGFHDAARNVDLAPAPLGRGNTGAYVGQATTTAGGVHGPALLLDGIGDFAYGGGIGDYNLAILRDLTISIRANYDTLSAAADGNTLVSHSDNMGGYTDREEALNQPYNLRLRSDRRLQLFWERDNNVKEVFTSTLAADVSPGEWHEYRVIRDAAAGEVTFWVDGVQLGSPLGFSALSQLPTGGAEGTLRIGINYNRDQAAKLVGGFDGRLDELVIWNEATTTAFIPPELPCDLFADITGDCSIDADDWLQFRLGQHTNLAGLTLTEAYAKGDLNGDFRNDHADFVLFKRAFEAANGAGSFATMLEAPEPAGAALLAVALASVVGRGRRGRAAVNRSAA